MTAPATSPVELFQFACQIPAGTPQSAPVTIAMTMPVRIVTLVEITVPTGPNGLMGFQIASASQPFFPRTKGTFYVASARTIQPPIQGNLQSGEWQLIGYNTGTYPHTVYVDFHCATVGPDLTAPPPAINPAVLSSQ